ncbi:hypothetical protein [Nocardia sp. NPDC051463]|uniref:hypothetical protein n=1 Tax=Nocardia sp. NPDC051463 TaxID=3154845 RepID=UPI00344C664F
MTTNNTDTLTTKLDALIDQMAWCPTCVYPGAERPAALDIGVPYACVACGVRFRIEFADAEAAPGILHSRAVPAA